MAAPSGRVTKPTPNVASAPNSRPNCDSAGKNASPIITAKKVQTRKWTRWTGRPKKRRSSYVEERDYMTWPNAAAVVSGTRPPPGS